MCPRWSDPGLATAGQRARRDIEDAGAGDDRDDERGEQEQREVGAALQCERARQNATTCSSAVFIGEAGNSASASTAIAP